MEKQKIENATNIIKVLKTLDSKQELNLSNFFIQKFVIYL